VGTNRKLEIVQNNKVAKNIISIIAHDAGGAELLSSYVIHHKDAVFIYALSGPAIKIFRRKLGVIKNFSINEAVSKSGTIFCGTGWQSKFELKGIIAARNMNKKSIAFLDHWVNYQERFAWNDKVILPNEIWVSDNYAQKQASSLFPEIRIRLIQNYYFEDIKKEYKKVEFNKRGQSKEVAVLFVSDNIDGVIERDFFETKYLLFTDQEIFRYLIRHMDSLSSKVKKVTIRPHPSELKTATKYEQVMSECKVLCKIEGKVSLLEEIANNDIIVGGDSMAMVVAMICGKEVYSCMPPGGKYTLPFDDIKRM
jgi:hypothetical protein